MRHHEFVLDMPFAAARIWALFQRYDLWKEYAPSVLDVEIVYPGDANGNGLLRKVIYPLPFGGRGVTAGALGRRSCSSNRRSVRRSLRMRLPALRCCASFSRL